MNQLGHQTCLEGVISRITFYASDTGYGIFRLTSDSFAFPECAIVGTLPNASVGLSVRVQGQWVVHPKYGRQLKAENIEEMLPKTRDGIRQFLGSGLIKGIGPKTAEKIVHTFGDQTLRILDGEPHRLQEIAGFSEKKKLLVVEGWKQYREVREVMMFLQSHGVSTAYAFRIYKCYGKRCVEVIQRNPYQVASDVWGIGFKIADQIASRLGISGDDPRRVIAGMQYVLGQQADSSGHTVVLQEQFVALVCALLAISQVLCEEILAGMIHRGELYRVGIGGEEGVALKKYYFLEQSLYFWFSKRKGKNHPETFRKPCEKWVDGYGAERLSDEQRQAIVTLACTGVGILTGGPGCGKTTALRAMVRMLETLGKRVICCAPTGRAARRMEEVIRVPARTIHRLLEFDPKNRKFTRDARYPLHGDYLIVDEASMVDVELALALVSAVPERMSVIWVGDKDQLPSVGAGAFFGDLIDLGLCPVARLTEIFRQGERSAIVRSAHHVNQGQFPSLQPYYAGRDFFYVEEPTPEAIQAAVLSCVTERIPKILGLASQDTKVLTPMHRGCIGTVELNAVLQARLNPKTDRDPHVLGAGGRRFYEKDVVLQKVNNHTTQVMNGEIGVIRQIQREDHQALVAFEDREIWYEEGDYEDLELGYAISIHKSQGSEFPAVVIPMHESHYIMLHRTLLYTAITRARKLCVLVGTKKAIGIAVGRSNLSHRWTLLPTFRGMVD